MESNEAFEYTTKKLEEFSKVVLTVSNSWDNELEYRLRRKDRNTANNTMLYGVFFGLLFIVNISVLVFSTTKNSDTKAVRQQDLKMIREELLIPNTL
jgi:hypothetical protein